MKTCKDCKWWVLDGSEVGLCHRFPSFPVWNPKLKKFQGGVPNTRPDYWCGEFKSEDMKTCKDCKWWGEKQVDMADLRYCGRKSPRFPESGWKIVDPSDTCDEFKSYCEDIKKGK